MRFWSILFSAAAIFTFGVCVYAPYNADWWLPPNVSAVSPLHFGADVDHLFILILWITGIVFVGTSIAIGYATWRYRAVPGGKASYTHGSQRLEVVWTIIPSAILVFIGLYQMGTWASIKFRSAQPKVKPTAEIVARQFQWMIRYPGPDGKLYTQDDFHTINDLHFVKDAPILIHLKSRDVLHSFFLPYFRIKQDAVPGLTIPVWFDADTAGSYDIVCAELCGWGHYKMRGSVTVHETQRELDEWQKQAIAAQNTSQIALAPATQGSK